MMEPILESEMQFGIYPEDAVFHLEQSDQYRKNMMPHGAKCCEFILLRNKKLYFIEAKKTSPKELTSDSVAEKRQKYKEYIDNITTKMRHSLAAYSSILLKRYDSSGISPNMQNPDLSNITLVFLLVIKNAGDKDQLNSLQEKLNKELKTDSSIWNNIRLYAINEEMARKKNFVV